MGQKFSNNFTTTLTSDITTSSTSLPLTAVPSPAIELPNSDDFFLLTLVDKNGAKEIVKCVGISGLNITVGVVWGTPSSDGRGQEGTTKIPITCADDHAVALRATRGTFELFASDIETLETNTTIADTAQAQAGTDDVQPLSSAKGRTMVDAYLPISSQSQAETGTDNVTRMTPLSTKQSVAYNTQLSSDSSPSLSGNLTQGENLTMIDPDISTDHGYSGEGFTGTVGINFQGFGSPLYCASNGEYKTCDADDPDTFPCRCLALETGTGSKTLLLKGFVRDDSWNWSDIGENIYVSGSVGQLTQTLPTGSGDCVQAVGYAVTADIMFFNPNYIAIELA